jgi:hypothetical protein
MREWTEKPDFRKIEFLCFTRTLSREWKDKPQTGRKYLQNIFDKGLLFEVYKLKTQQLKVVLEQYANDH